MAMPDATITRGPATFVGLSGLYSAAVAYLTLLVAARSLTPDDNAIFLVYWALLFGAYGVVTGVTPEAARASYQPDPDRRGASLLGVALGYGALVSTVLAASSALWAPRVLPGHAGAGAGGRRGMPRLHRASCRVGRRHRRTTAGPRSPDLLVAESTVRLVLVVLAFAVFDNVVALAVAAALPAVTWVAAQVVPVFAGPLGDGAISPRVVCCATTPSPRSPRRPALW